jgi:transcriptional regulator with XRE-family HTH domain
VPRLTVSQSPKIPEREAAICERLRAKRRELGIQQKEVARRINVPLDTFRGYEYARSPLRYGAAKRFCDEFDVNQRWLSTGDLPRKPYLELSSVVEQFIPDDMLFSKVADALLDSLIEEALEDIADIVSEKCEIAEIDKWDHIPWAPILIPTRQEQQRSFLHNIEESVAHTFQLLPQQLIGQFDLELRDFLTDFRRKHGKTIQKFLEDVRRDPMSEIRKDEQIARELISRSLGIDPEQLRHTTMLQTGLKKR